MMAQTQVKGNSCKCLNITCNQTNVPCSKDECMTCKSCCDPKCERCVKICTKGKKCKCSYVRCGCKEDCNKDDGDGKCKGIKTRSCQRCQKRCKPEGPCICYFCNCGKHCNGVICSCCKWCDPKNCSGEECNGFVIGRCGDKCPKPNKCEGHVKYDNGKDGEYRAVLDRAAENVIECDGKPHGVSKCTNKNCNWLGGVLQADGNCVMFCTYCNKLCGQDNFRRCCYVAVPLFITVSAFLIFRFMLPEEFHAITTKIRAAFPSAPRHPGRSLSNLVGNRLPEEMSVDRYPAFRPKAFAGLS